MRRPPNAPLFPYTTLFRSARIGMARMIRQTLEQSGQAEKMSAEQMQQAIDRGAQIGGIIAHVAGVLGVPIFILLVAAVGLLFTNAFFGAEVRFKTSLAVASYANLIRSEEHTSELQSHSDLVCRLLLEK